MSTCTVTKDAWFVQERLRLTAVLTRSGESASAIAVRLHVTRRTVERYRARLRRAQSQK